MRGAQRGLTLVELLAALAVLAVLAALSVRGISSLVQAEGRLRAETTDWHAVSRVLEQMQRDLSLALEAPSAEPQGTLVIRRRSDADAASGDVRPRTVAFRVDGGGLQYLRWTPSGGASPETSPALENVRSVEWRVLRNDGEWIALAPSLAAPLATRAVEARLTLRGGEQVRRVFLLP